MDDNNAATSLAASPAPDDNGLGAGMEHSCWLDERYESASTVANNTDDGNEVIPHEGVEVSMATSSH